LQLQHFTDYTVQDNANAHNIHKTLLDWHQIYRIYQPWMTLNGRNAPF